MSGDPLAHPPGVARLRAPAKLTLSLEVTGRRPNGYHEIRSEMVSLDLGDELDVEAADVTTVTFASTADARLRVTASPGEDLVSRALAFAGVGARVVVRKHVPVGGGLGGGSADAGAVLRWAGWVDLAATSVLGGDVPFCVHGGRALVEGIGEIVTPLAFEARRVTLAVPAFGVDTGACYRAFDEMDVAPAGRNHLRAAARLVEPRLATALDWLAAETGHVVELCGSGSSMFLEADLVGEATDTVLDSPVGPVRLFAASTTPPQ